MQGFKGCNTMIVSADKARAESGTADNYTLRLDNRVNKLIVYIRSTISTDNIAFSRSLWILGRRITGSVRLLLYPVRVYSA